MKITLIGIDPGIIDSGIVAIRLDFSTMSWSVRSEVWTNVTYRSERVSYTQPWFLDALKRFIAQEKELAQQVHVGVENFRARGRDQRQDEKMRNLIQDIVRATGAKNVDNTGIKKIVKEATMRLFRVTRFPSSDNHADRKSAARVALRLGIEDPVLNRYLSMFMYDMLYTEDPWQYVST
jgi:hypothetical protein